ncbi:Type II secretion system F domain protein [metagenome]|uniref:Type II secretion system F domain protein n=1 Tax=metagenome TaxID=256318 RepID=A0A2P2CF26_9ZZZZ
MTWALVCAGCAAAAAGLVSASVTRWRVPLRRPGGRRESATGEGLMARGRWLWVSLAFVAGVVFGPGRSGVPLGAMGAVGVWWLVSRAEPPAARRRREAVRRDLPHVVELFAAALAAGGAPTGALGQVCRALPGPAADELRDVTAGLGLGRPPLDVWLDLSRHPQLGALGRTMARAERSGAPVVEEVRRLADDLASEARVELEDRARAVGVKAALPLGLCLLPAFLVLGIVPLVVGAVGAIRW